MIQSQKFSDALGFLFLSPTFESSKKCMYSPMTFTYIRTATREALRAKIIRFKSGAKVLAKPNCSLCETLKWYTVHPCSSRDFKIERHQRMRKKNWNKESRIELMKPSLEPKMSDFFYLRLAAYWQSLELQGCIVFHLKVLIDVELHISCSGM